MATIKDIAKRANVSIGTVDRVIHKRGFVAYETQKKVEQAIEELAYKPNIYARQLKLAKKYNFGVLIPEVHQDANYWEQHVIGIREAEKELEAYNLQIKFFHFDRYSEQSFYKNFLKALDCGLDGMMIAPIFVNPVKELVNRIPENIPYVFFDSDLPDTKRLTFIGQDPYSSGLLAGKLMKMLTDDKGEIAIIRILPEDYHINRRTEGFCSYYRDNPSDNTISIYEWQENEDLNSINTLIEEILNKDNLQGFFVTNALTFLVASYINSHNSGKKIRVLGYDLVKENVTFLNESVIDFLISQSPITQGYQGIRTLFRKLVLNQKIENTIMMPIDIVTKENIGFYNYKKN